MEDKKILMIIAPEDFRDEEFLEPKEVFESSGAVVTVASKDTDSARGSYGAMVSVDTDILDVDVDNYDAVVFVGGRGSSVYFEDEVALKLAREAYDGGKIVAAICIAPSILANADILEGSVATSFPSEESNLVEHGAEYTGKDVEVDGRIITGSGPHAATEFGQKIMEKLKTDSAN